MRRFALVIMLCVFGTAVAAATAVGRRAKPVAEKEFTVVLDPGHGGRDLGCQGAVAKEKNITLDVARRVSDLIAASDMKIRTVMTRNSDRYLTLQQRADIANRADGDLFISIHVNSVDRKSRGRASVQGCSVYAVGADKDRSTLTVAMRENSVMELEDDFTTKYSGFDPSSAESYIIFELSNSMHLKQSLTFADITRQHLVADAGRADKGVRQAGFWVLWATSMPAVLVELDFICNPTQEAFLNSDEGRGRCANAIFNAISEYYRTHAAPSMLKTDK